MDIFCHLVVGANVSYREGEASDPVPDYEEETKFLVESTRPTGLNLPDWHDRSCR